MAYVAPGTGCWDKFFELAPGVSVPATTVMETRQKTTRVPIPGAAPVVPPPPPPVMEFEDTPVWEALKRPAILAGVLVLLMAFGYVSGLLLFLAAACWAVYAAATRPTAESARQKAQADYQRRVAAHNSQQQVKRTKEVTTTYQVPIRKEGTREDVKDKVRSIVHAGGSNLPGKVEKELSVSREASLWAVGAVGEEQVGLALEGSPHLNEVVHDLDIVKWRKDQDSNFQWERRVVANIDHLAHGTPGTLVVDAKVWSGFVQNVNGEAADVGLMQRFPDSIPRQKSVETVVWEAAQLSGGASAVILCVVGGRVEGGFFEVTAPCRIRAARSTWPRLAAWISCWRACLRSAPRHWVRYLHNQMI